MCMLFFFKHETAYEMRISDWSSDVCSSDLFFVVAFLFRSHAAFEDLFGFGGKLPGYLVFSASEDEGFYQVLQPFQLLFVILLFDGELEIGRASCRERVCQYV